MGLLLSLAGGLAVGLSLLVWALRERSQRAEAERLYLERGVDLEKAHVALKRAEATAKVYQEASDAKDKQLLVVLDQVKQLRKLVLANVQDPEAVRQMYEQIVSTAQPPKTE